LINDLTPPWPLILSKNVTERSRDLLGDLPRAKAEGILNEMEKDIADDVKELLTHPEREAGGMMTTSYLSFRSINTVRTTGKISPGGSGC